MIRVIVAIDDKKGLANDKGIPWDLPADRRYFREKTEHSTILMGYRTYTEFENPLPNRRNLVASSQDIEMREGFELIPDVRAFLEQVNEDIWVIGGAGLIKATLDLVDEIYITQLEGDFGCTKFMPNYEDDFEMAEATKFMQDNNIKFRYETWKRKTKN